MRITTTEKCYASAPDSVLQETLTEIKNNIGSLYALLPPLPKKAPRGVLAQIKKMAKEGHVVMAELNYRKAHKVSREYLFAKTKPTRRSRYLHWVLSTRREA